MTTRDGTLTPRRGDRGILGHTPPGTPPTLASAAMTRLLAFAAAFVGFAIPFGVLAAPAAAQTLASATLSATSATTHVFDGRAERLVAAWVAGDAAPTVAAFADTFRAAGAVAVPRVVRALGRRYGRLTGVAAEGTVVRPDGRRETVVALAYALGTERLRLTWNADGTLRTLARAPRAALVASR